MHCVKWLAVGPISCIPVRGNSRVPTWILISHLRECLTFSSENRHEHQLNGFRQEVMSLAIKTGFLCQCLKAILLRGVTGMHVCVSWVGFDPCKSEWNYRKLPTLSPQEHRKKATIPKRKMHVKVPEPHFTVFPTFSDWNVGQTVTSNIRKYT